MKVQFMLDFREDLHPNMNDIETSVIETYEDPERPGFGYDVVEADVPHLGAVQTTCNGNNWFAAEANMIENNGGVAFFVTAWEEMQ